MKVRTVVVTANKSRGTLKGVKAGLPRLTNVEPLPAAVWRRIYSRPDELAGVTAAQLAASQVQEVPTSGGGPAS